MRNKFSSNLLQKGLISLAAASVLATGAMAAIGTITAGNFFLNDSAVASEANASGKPIITSDVFSSGFFVNNVYLDINDSNGSSDLAGWRVYIELPTGAEFAQAPIARMLTKDSNYTRTMNLTPNGDHLAGTYKDSNSSVFSRSGYTGYTSAIASTASSTSQYYIDFGRAPYTGKDNVEVNLTSIGWVDTTGITVLIPATQADGNVTSTLAFEDIKIKITDATKFASATTGSIYALGRDTNGSELNVTLKVYKSGSVTKVKNSAIELGKGVGEYLSDGQVVVGQIFKGVSLASSPVLYPATLPNIKTLTSASLVSRGIDQNLTLVFNLAADTATDRNITLTLPTGLQWIGASAGSTTPSVLWDINLSNDADAAGLDLNRSTSTSGAIVGRTNYIFDGAKRRGVTSTGLTDDNRTLRVAGNFKNANGSQLVMQIPYSNMYATTSLSTGDVMVTIGTGSDSNLSSILSTSYTNNQFKIATASATDSMIIADGNNSKNYIFANRSEQLVTDVNITEANVDTFTSGKTIIMTLPTGYTFTSTPKVNRYNYKTMALIATDTYLINPIGKNSWTITFGSTEEDSTVITSSTTVERLKISDIKIAVPSDAVGGTQIPISFSGTQLTTSTPNVTSLNVGEVKESATKVSYTYNPAHADLTFAQGTADNDMGSVTGTNAAKIYISEEVIGALSLGDKITITLPTGVVFATLNGAITVTNNVGSNGTQLVLGDTYSATTTDTNNSVVLTVNTISSSKEGNTSIQFGDLNLQGLANLGTLNVTLSGAVEATVPLFTAVESADVSVVSYTEADAGSVQVEAGTLYLKENIKTGLTLNNSFKLVSTTSGITFAGYKYSYKNGSGSWNTGTTVIGESNITNTFSSSDTIAISLTNIATTTVDEVKITPIVNILSGIADGMVTFSIAKYQSQSTLPSKYTSFDLLNVGTLADLTLSDAEKTIKVGESATVTASPVNGTLTATSDNTNVTTSVSGDTITISVSASAVSGETATISVSDSRGVISTVTVTVSADAVVPVTTTAADITSLGQTADTTKLKVALKNSGVVENSDGTMTVNDKMKLTITATSITVEATQDGYTVKSVEIVDSIPTGRAVVEEVEYIQIADSKYLKVTLEKTVADMSTTPELVAGWNLLGNSSNDAQSVSKDDISITWTYDMDAMSWTKDALVSVGQGFWAKADVDMAGYEFPMSGTGDAVMPTFTAGKWSLMSSATAQTLADVLTANEGSTIAWTFRDGSWANDDVTSIEAGRGYWVK